MVENTESIYGSFATSVRSRNGGSRQSICRLSLQKAFKLESTGATPTEHKKQDKQVTTNKYMAQVRRLNSRRALFIIENFEREMKQKCPNAEHFLSRNESTCSVDAEGIDEHADNPTKTTTLQAQQNSSAASDSEKENIEFEPMQEVGQVNLPCFAAISKAPRDTIQKRALPMQSQPVRPLYSSEIVVSHDISKTELSLAQNEQQVACSERQQEPQNHSGSFRRVFVEDYVDCQFSFGDGLQIEDQHSKSQSLLEAGRRQQSQPQFRQQQQVSHGNKIAPSFWQRSSFMRQRPQSMSVVNPFNFSIIRRPSTELDSYEQDTVVVESEEIKDSAAHQSVQWTVENVDESLVVCKEDDNEDEQLDYDSDLPTPECEPDWRDGIDLGSAEKAEETVESVKMSIFESEEPSTLKRLRPNEAIQVEEALPKPINLSNSVGLHTSNEMLTMTVNNFSSILSNRESEPLKPDSSEKDHYKTWSGQSLQERIQQDSQQETSERTAKNQSKIDQNQSRQNKIEQQIEMGLVCTLYDHVTLVEHKRVLIQLELVAKRLTIQSLSSKSNAGLNGCSGSPSVQSKTSSSSSPGKKVIRESIDIHQLKGFLIGAISSRFQKIQQIYPEIAEDENEWRYISLVTKQAETIDLKFAKLSDSVDFIIAVSDTIKMLNNKKQRKKSSGTNRGVVTMLLLRAKLEKMAKKREMSLHGLLSRAMYLTVAQKMPDDRFEEAWIKHAELEKLERLCKRYSVKLSGQDRLVFTRLRDQMQLLKKVDLTVAQEFKQALQALNVQSQTSRNSTAGSFQEQLFAKTQLKVGPQQSQQTLRELMQPSLAQRKVQSFCHQVDERGSLLPISNSTQSKVETRIPAPISRMGVTDANDLEKKFQLGLKEAERLYELGLSRFVETKAMKLGMKQPAVGKLRIMLLKHHRSRLDKIKRVEGLKTRVQEIEMLITRYKVTCFSDVSFQNQFWVDLSAIHLIPQTLKDAYLEQLHANQEQRFEIALARAANQMQSLVRLAGPNEVELASLTELVEKESPPKAVPSGKLKKM